MAAAHGGHVGWLEAARGELVAFLDAGWMLGAVLMATSYPNRTAPVIRGAWVMDKLMGTPPTPPPPVNGMSIYGDALVNGWNNWSWASVNTASTATVHTGSTAIAVDADGFEALYLQHAAMLRHLENVERAVTE